MSMRRWLPLAVAVAGLIAVAALASHGHPLSRSHGSGPTPAFFDYVLTTAILAAIGTLVLVVVAALHLRSGAPPVGQPRWNVLQLLAMFALSTLVALAVVHARFHAAATHQPGAAAKPPKAAFHEPGAAGRRNARFRWDEVAIVAALLAAAGIAAYASRPKKTPKVWRFSSHEEVALALDESLDDLRAEPDVRRAIIAAYARMERALAVAGLARHPSEAPLEYMSRALRQLDASTPAVSRLTELFQRAKFSHHDPDESMRDEAIAALVAVRDELRQPIEVAA